MGRRLNLGDDEGGVRLPVEGEAPHSFSGADLHSGVLRIRGLATWRPVLPGFVVVRYLVSTL